LRAAYFLPPICVIIDRTARFHDEASAAGARCCEIVIALSEKSACRDFYWTEFGADHGSPSAAAISEHSYLENLRMNLFGAITT
jgi:hypothetical protein